MTLKDKFANIDKTALRNAARKGIKVASEAASVAVQLRNDSGPLGVLSVAAKVADAMMGDSGSDSLRGYASVSGITPLERQTLTAARARKLVESQPGPSPGTINWFGTINGVRLAWQEYETWVDGPLVGEGFTPAEARNAVRALLWEVSGTALVFNQQHDGPATLDADDDEVLASQLAEDIWTRQRAFLDAGYPCFVLLAGEPGTGKSNVARYVAQRAGGLRLRVPARDLENMRSLGRLVRFLQPSAVVVDDLCRAPNKEGTLAVIDELTRSTKLLIVTVNRIDLLDPAVIRRADDNYTVDKLDDDVLASMLRDVPEHVAGKLRELPIKYIAQYRREVAVFGHERAEVELDALVRRRELVQRLMGSDVSSSEPASSSKGVADLLTLKVETRRA